jgi:RHS repeat-associated protein
VTLTYTSDANGNRTSVSGPGGVVNYQYDSRARLTSVRDGGGRTFTLTYDGTNRLTGLTRPNGVNDALTYQEDVLTARNASLNGLVVGQEQYTLDALRRRTSLTDFTGTHTFTHDAVDQLTGAVHSAASGLPVESFAYDSVGNRTSWTGSPSSTVSYGAGDQLQSDGTYVYTYDAEGRVITRTNRATGGTTRYVWNGAGQLASVTAENGAVSTYRYDGFGRRVEVNDDGTVRRFVYSGWNLNSEYDGTNTLLTTYVTGTDMNSVYEMVRGGTPYYPLFDAAGSVIALTDPTGAVAGRTNYSAFGAPQPSGVSDDGFTFTGQQYDSATGLVYARARYYDPTIGRFLSQDPDPSINPYPYASNAPLEVVDPTGRAGLLEYIFGTKKKQEDEETIAAREFLKELEKKGYDIETKLESTGQRTPIKDVWKPGG